MSDTAATTRTPDRMKEEDIRTLADMRIYLELQGSVSGSEWNRLGREREERNRVEVFNLLGQHNILKVTVDFSGEQYNDGYRDDPTWVFQPDWTCSAVNTQGEKIDLDGDDAVENVMDDIFSGIQDDFVGGGGDDDEQDSAKGTVVFDVPGRTINLTATTSCWVTVCKKEQVDETWTVGKTKTEAA